MTEVLQRVVAWRPSEGPTGRVGFVALCVFTFVLLLSPQTVVPALTYVHLALCAIAVAMVSLWVTHTTTGRPLLTLPRGTWPALALAIWALFTMPLSRWPGGSFDLFSELFVKSLIVLWLIPQVVDTRERLRRLIAWMCLLGIVLGLTAITHFLGGDFESVEGGVRRIQGYDAPLTGNPNDLALTLNMLLPLTGALWAIYQRRIVRLALTGVIALQVAAVIATFSRGGFITLALIALFHTLRSLRGLKRLMIPLFLGGALLGMKVMPTGYAEHLTTTVDIQADTTGSAQARWMEVVAAADATWSQPLVGQGLGMNILAVTNELNGDWRTVHDVYLQYAADLGLPGLALFVILIVGCLRAVRRVARETEAPDLRHLARGIELSLWAYVVEATFHPAGYHFYFYYFGGLALAARAIHERETA